MKTVNYLILFLFLIIGTVATSQSYIIESQKDLIKQSKVSLDSTRYYYFPNLEAYYDTKNSMYIFKRKGEWVTESHIPANYRGYSLFNKRYEIINGLVDTDTPQEFIEQHRKEYPPIFKAKDMKIKLDKEKNSSLTYN